MRSNKGYSVVMDDGVCAGSLCQDEAAGIHENEFWQGVYCGDGVCAISLCPNGAGAIHKNEF